MQRRFSTTATVAGVNGDLFNASVGYPSGLLLMNGVLASPPNPDRSSTGIAPDGTLRVDRIKFAGTWQGAGQRRPLVLNKDPAPGGTALYTPAYGPATPAAERDGRGRAHAVSGGCAAPRPRRHRRAGEAGRCDADPAGRRGARRPRCDRRGPACDRSAARIERDRPPDADARLVGARRRRRRRAGARARRAADLPLERRVHHRPAGAAAAANGRRPDAGRAHRARHGRRATRRLQRRDDELRARAAPDAPRRVDRVGARRRRLVDDGVRGHAAQPAVRSRRRALDRGVPQPLLLRRPRARAAARRRLAERRQRQRAPDARVQDRARLDGERAARSRRTAASSPSTSARKTRRRHVPLPVGSDRARRNLALRRRLDRRPRPRVAGRALVLAEQHARLARPSAPCAAAAPSRGSFTLSRPAQVRGTILTASGSHASHAARSEPRRRARERSRGTGAARTVRSCAPAATSSGSLPRTASAPSR